MKELQETHNQKVKSQVDLLASIDRLSKQVADLTEDNRKLQQQIETAETDKIETDRSINKND